MPGDKSISHRALIFGLLTRGETVIEGLLEGEDVLATGRACAALGAKVARQGQGAWTVSGTGVGALLEPRDVLDFGNAGTGSRLMMGVVARARHHRDVRRRRLPAQAADAPGSRPADPDGRRSRRGGRRRPPAPDAARHPGPAADHL